MISVARPLLGAEEEAALLQVFASGNLVQGENVAAFERRFAEICGTREAVAVSSGTAALHLALLAHEIGQGDEVITTAFSFAATANVILLVGATPVFVDIDPRTFTIDPAQVAMAITPRTKALLPVHLYGYPCALLHLLELAREHGLALIEDACQAHAASIEGQPVGSFGTGCFSFYATKNMTTGEGGMVTTSDPIIAERVRLLRQHGQVKRYCHTHLGYNLRMTEMQAAIGLIQAEKLEQFTRKRIAHAMYLNQCLSSLVETPYAYPGYRHVYHQYTIRVPESEDRAAWMRQLQTQGVGTAIHYPSPIHCQPFYQASPHLYRLAGPDRNDCSTLPAAEKAARQVLSLPVHPGLREEDLETIVQEVSALCA